MIFGRDMAYISEYVRNSLLTTITTQTVTFVRPSRLNESSQKVADGLVLQNGEFPFQSSCISLYLDNFQPRYALLMRKSSNFQLTTTTIQMVTFVRPSRLNKSSQKVGDGLALQSVTSSFQSLSIFLNLDDFRPRYSLLKSLYPTTTTQMVSFPKRTYILIFE